MAVQSFKSDESFLQKLSVGATGTKATIRRLEELGFKPIELERGSTGFKIWKKIKIKRVRVPDILCLKSGQRFESRGKTKLEISMSHSLRDPNRSWDAGLRPDDYVAVVLCYQKSDSPIDWEIASPVHFILVSDMQKAFSLKKVQITKPKGVEEGSEIRIIWPSVASNEASVLSEINSKSLKLSPISGGRPQRCVLDRKNITLKAQCNIGDTIQANQIVASTVPIHLNLVCPVEVSEDYFLRQLKSASLSERYAAAKALRFRGYSSGQPFLEDRINDPSEDIYVKLEAAAALAANGDQKGWDFMSGSIKSEYLTVQLETVIVMSEIRHPNSEEMLINVLTDKDRDDEVRAGAAWALGEFATGKTSTALVNTFNFTNTEIRIEAARALLKIAPTQRTPLIQLIKSVDSAKRDGIAWVLAKTGIFDPCELLENRDDINLRRWTSYIVGYGKSLFAEEKINTLCSEDPEVYFAASVLWQILSSWIYELKEY